MKHVGRGRGTYCLLSIYSVDDAASSFTTRRTALFATSFFLGEKKGHSETLTHFLFLLPRFLVFGFWFFLTASRKQS